jgi:hypothetical protein
MMMMKHKPFVLLALLTLGVAVLAIAGDHDTALYSTANVPTPSHFAHPVTKYIPLPEKHGILACESEWQYCRVRNMPLILQTDPRLYLPAKLAYLPPVGCYDTSIVTIVLTALANRDPKLSVVNRSKMFMDIPSSGAVPKEVEQLKQQYVWAYDFQHGVAAGGKVPNPMYIHEALADAGGGKMNEKCDPYSYRSCSDASNTAGRAFSQSVQDDSVTNASIIGLMKTGYATLVAFARYQMVAIPDGRGGVASRKLVRESQHKVVFSGFQPGKYPLLINDVGNGHRYRVRLSTDLSSRGLSPAYPFTYPLPTHTFLEYEGQDQTQVFFIEGIDAIRIETGDSSPFPAPTQHTSAAH